MAVVGEYNIHWSMKIPCPMAHAHIQCRIVLRVVSCRMSGNECVCVQDDVYHQAIASCCGWRDGSGGLGYHESDHAY